VSRKKRDDNPPVKFRQDPVTHELTATVWDDVQKAYQRCVDTVERELLRLSAADGERLVGRLLAALAKKVPHTDGPAKTEAA
jgi:hypothetical protein